METTRERRGWRSAVGSFLSHAIVGLSAGLVIAFLALAGIVDMVAAHVVLGIAWAIAVVGLCLTDWIWNKKWWAKIVWILVIALALGACAERLRIWASHKSEQSKLKDRNELARELARQIPTPSILTGVGIVDFGVMCDGCCSKPQRVSVPGVRPGDAATVSFLKVPRGLQQGPVTVPLDDVIEVSVCNLSGGPIKYNSVPITSQVTRRH